MKMVRVFALFFALVLLTSCTPAEPVQDDEDMPVESVEQIESDEPVESDEPEDEPYVPQYLIPAYDERLPSLKEHFDGVMLVGAAINTPRIVEDTKFYDVMMKHYNVFVLENEMKPENINPRNGEFSFKFADKFVEFGEKTGVALRGHTLVWHSQVPGWWFRGENGERATREQLLARMEEYITTVVERYKGKIDTWDVVNEVFSNDHADLRREDEDSLWTAIIGDADGDGYDTDYIEQAFYFAHAADPDAQLILNEYGMEYDADKLETLYQNVKRMMEKGVPIDGVGLQLHTQYNGSSAEQVEKVIEYLATLKEINPDFVVQITELDVSIFAWNDDSLEKEMGLIEQTQFAGRYGDLFDVFARQAALGNVDQVLTWGVWDANTWKNSMPIKGRTDEPLLFDRNWNAKPAFWAIIDRELLPAVFEEVKILKE